MERENQKRYVIETWFGPCLVDEGAYRDYLAGDSWLNWTPGKKKNKTKTAAAEEGWSREVLEWREQADRTGIKAAVEAFGAEPFLPELIPERLYPLSIQELDLTVRASNGLMRAGADQVSKVLDLMKGERGLMAVRNLGLKSTAEIQTVLLEECYHRMTPSERGAFWKKLQHQNGKEDMNDGSFR